MARGVARQLLPESLTLFQVQPRAVGVLPNARFQCHARSDDGVPRWPTQERASLSIGADY